jgi:lipopolysaccharide export system protein LptA
MHTSFPRATVLGAALAGLALAAGLWSAPVLAQQGRPAGSNTSTPLSSLGGNSRDPIKIDADRLDVRDRESMAIFSGNVVAVQGKTTIRCSKMTIVYENRQGVGAARTPAAGAASGAGAGDSAIRRLECDGPVTVASDDQVATGQKAVFDRERDLVTLTGGVALAKGPNVTRGERLVYNLKTGVANIDGGRVQGFFVPGSAEPPQQQQPRAPRRPGEATN